MTMTKAQRYERLSKRAGIAACICLVLWLLFMGVAALSYSPSSPYENSQQWIGVACGLTFLATVACAVTCLAAAILSRFKNSDQDSAP